MGTELNQKHHWWAVGLLSGGLLVRSAIALSLPPGFDEAYYYLYTQHPDWSYFDHPLLVTLSTGLGPWLTGHVSQFTIRLGTLWLHTGALWLLYLTSLRLFSARAAILTLAIASLIPIFLVGFGVLTLPDAPLIFFWTATLYVASWEFFPKQWAEYGEQDPRYRIQRTGDGGEAGKTPPSSLLSASPSPYPAGTPEANTPLPYTPTYRLALLGLLVGLACLSKYHGLALGFGLVGFCLTSPRYRSALRSPWMLVSVGLFLFAIAPILIWNIQHDWVSLRFQSGRAIPDRSYSLLDLLITFLVGVAYLFPSFGVPLWWVSGRVLANERVLVKQRSKPLTTSHQLLTAPSPPLPPILLLWTALPLMLVFTLMGGYRPILPTWAMPGFWSATLLLGWKAADWQQKSPRLVRRWLWGSGVAIATFLLIALLHVNFGTFQKPGRYALFGGFLSPDADASIQLMDIQQIRSGFVESPPLKEALQTSDFLFTNDLFLAGQISMALAPLPPRPITVLDADLRGFAFWSASREWLGQNGLLVTLEPRAETTLAQYQGYFERIQPIAEIPIYRGGVMVQKIQVYQCDRLRKPYPRPYGSRQ
ncbi:ArnT family glycosyltransferase [Leptothermofonsia sichuanensis]|uniref:ArnT family glycosyltransferase n=1 Tax=Leptothermofonsia sichuanensis TaxID=2917832 RepID=UPI001CA6F86B|nr:glycosyltransferase family 39 protein [Leptothermofonsia sichuanensis]